MEILKSKTTLLVALVLAAVLAMTGVGYALAATKYEKVEVGVGETQTAQFKHSRVFKCSDCGNALYKANQMRDFNLESISITDGNDQPADGASVTINSEDQSLLITGVTPGTYTISCEYSYSFDFSDAPEVTTCSECERTNQFNIQAMQDSVYYGDAVIEVLVTEFESTNNPSDTPTPDNPDDPNDKKTLVGFNIHFKATGIQSTGFNDYHEAFAALNN